MNIAFCVDPELLNKYTENLKKGIFPCPKIFTSENIDELKKAIFRDDVPNNLRQKSQRGIFNDFSK